MFPPLNKSFTATAESVLFTRRVKEFQSESNYRCCSFYGLGKGCLIAPINTCHSCRSVEFEVWLSSSAGVQTPWTCAATVGARLGRRGLFPRDCHFQERGAPSDLSQVGTASFLEGGDAWGCDFSSPVSVLPWTSPEVLGRHLQP